MALSTDQTSMLAHYAENVAPTSRRKYVAAVRRFVEFASGDFSADKLLAYIRYLENAGYMSNTIRRFDLTAIRRFFKVNALPWPLKPWELPTVSERDVYAPALATEVIERLVAAAKAGQVSAQDAALLALATVYGLRRVEMTTVTPADVDLDHRLLYVRTAKHGRERWHTVPTPIVPYLRDRSETAAFATAGVESFLSTGDRRRLATNGRSGLPCYSASTHQTIGRSRASRTGHP